MLHVLTSEMVRFEIDAKSWKTMRYINGEEGVTQLVTEVYSEAGERVAEFADLHAIWNGEKGTLVKPDDN